LQQLASKLSEFMSKV